MSQGGDDAPDAPGSTTDYRGFGLNIRSDLPLAELSTAEIDQPDIIVRRRSIPIDRWPAVGERIVETDGNGFFLQWGGIGLFRLDGDRHIDYDPAPDFDLSLLSLAVLGPVMAVLLHSRGMFILHGSAIMIDGRAAIFLGDKGDGKSTTAASMLAAGHRLVTDDVVAIEFPEGEAPRVVPGYPQIKLSTDAAAQLTLPAHSLIPTDYPGFDKQRVRLPGSFCSEPVPIGAVYVLERGSEATVTPLDPVESLRALLRFSYIVRFGEVLLQGNLAGRHMAAAAAVAAAAPVCHLQVPKGIDRLPQAVALVEEHLASS